MQQMITGPRRATPRTLIAGQQKKWTLRKPLISRSGWIEEKEEDGSRSDCHPSRRRNSKLSSSVSGDVNKMKIRHDLKPEQSSSSKGLSQKSKLLWLAASKSPKAPL